MKQTHKLFEYLNKLESVIPQHKETNLKVSQSTVGWQIDHSLKVINSVCQALEASDPKDYKNNFKFLGKVFLWLGYFPRGKARAPKYVVPPKFILEKDLISQLKDAKSNIENLSSLDENSFFKHPLFGNVNKNRVYRFLETHTMHHLKIISDILNK